MTESQRAAQRASNRDRAQARRTHMTKEQREAHRAYNQSRQRDRRANMTEAQLQHQREIWCVAAQRRRQQLRPQNDQLEIHSSALQSAAAPAPQTASLAAPSNNECRHSNMTSEVRNCAPQPTVVPARQTSAPAAPSSDECFSNCCCSFEDLKTCSK